MTIPLQKLLVVEYRHVMRSEEIIRVIGLPAGVRKSVIYVRTADRIAIIPIASIVAIRAFP